MQTMLESLPKPASDAYLWADYIELLCLFNSDGICSLSDLLDRIREREDLGGELEELKDELGIPDESEYGLTYETDITTAEIDDKWGLEADDWFKHLRYRCSIFGDFYPFILADDSSFLSRKPELNTRHKLYIFLLLSSNLDRFKQYNNSFTSSFEIISYEGLKRCLPEAARVHVFSRNPSSDGRYTGENLWGKINKLAKDIKETVHIPESEFKPTDNADNGLDLVGWVPYHEDDCCDRLFLIFCQCACGPQWPRKPRESSVDHWRTVFTLKTPPSNMVFIPYCFRKADGTWYRERDIDYGYILIDRPRLIYLLQERYEVFSSQPSYKIVEKILEERDAIF